MANRGGGPDNSTLIILHLRSIDEQAGVEDHELPAEELREPAVLRRPDRDLIAPRWPIVALLLGMVFLTLGIAKLFFDVDLWTRLLDVLMGE